MKRRYAGLQPLIAALLLIAFLPTLSFVGHWGEIFGGQRDPPVPASAMLDLAAQRAEQTEHSQHCHTDLASCSAQPMPSGLGLFATHETLLRRLALSFIARQGDTLATPSGRVVPPLFPPPRTV